MTLVSQITTHVSLFNSYFLNNGSNYALMSDIEFENSKIFWCMDWGSARDFTCQLPYDVCQCQSAEKRVNCACRAQIFLKAFEKSAFPLVLPGMILKTATDGLIHAEMQQNSALQVQIIFKDFRLVNFVDRTMCYAQVIEATLCYRCSSGMELALECSADTDNTMAHIHCDENLDFYVTCSKSKEIHRKRLQIFRAYVVMNCSIHCSGGSSFFSFNASLYYMPNKGDQGWFVGPAAIGPPPGIDWKFIGEWILSDWWKTLGVAISVMLAIGFPITSFFGIYLSAAARFICRCLPKRRRHRE
jgi:hypothetical protein